VKILFLSYGGHDCNSLPHIAGFARELCGLEEVEKVAIAVPGQRLEEAEAQQILADQRLEAAFSTGRLVLRSHGEALAEIAGGSAYDILHLWTPREVNRRWLQAAALSWPDATQPWPAVLIHLEDNEEAICERAFGGVEGWENAADTFEPRQFAPYSHPRHYRGLLQLAEGATVIWESLAEYVPSTTPAMELLPGVDLLRFSPRPPDEQLAEILKVNPLSWRELATLTPGAGLPAHLAGRELVVCYNGNTTFANLADMTELYMALHLLWEEGWPIRLLRTGRDQVQLRESLPFDPSPWLTELGFIAREDLPALFSLAHLFIQPGGPDAFNDFRLPSKLPEYLASGGICLLPASNIGLRLRDGAEALVLQRGDAGEMVARVRAFLQEPDQFELMGQRARRFAQEQFDPRRQATYLRGFYQQCLAGIRKSAGKRAGEVATPGLALLAGVGRESATPFQEPARDLATHHAAITLLAARLREVQEAELAPLQQEFRALKKELKKTSKTAAAQEEKLGEITGSKAWRTLGKTLFKLERKGKNPG
jgi:hypothetical protein